ncbi:MAG: P1 family peptidase [Candidatus Dormibacteria bacterium]
MAPGPTNSLLDVAGLRVGHAQRVGDGWLTGTTVVLAGVPGAVAGVDVRGGGPGTRETDLLDPRNLVERVQAVVLSGGSAYGLASADGVMRGLAEDGLGLTVGLGQVVPIVPAAIIFDLGRGGEFRNHPGPELGLEAYFRARDGDDGGAQGCVGAGTGAVAGGLKGGVGTASSHLAGGFTVGALVVVNAMGSTVDPSTGLLWAATGDPWLRAALQGAHPARPEVPTGPPPGLNTTVGVVATDAPLSKAQCRKLAEAGQDGMARAIRPCHTMYDGDTVFGLSTADSKGATSPADLNELLTAAADCFTRAVGLAMLAATSTVTAGGAWRSYRDLHLSPARGEG